MATANPKLGSGIGAYKRGARVTRVQQVKVGDLLADHNPQFDAMNLIRVTRLADDGSRFYARHIDPQNASRRRYSTAEFCVRAFQIGQMYLLNRAVAPTK